MGFDQNVEALYEKIKKQAEGSGYHLNPDADFAKALIDGLAINEGRYGYMLCPCRLASGDRMKDLDIICPCDYRDADITEFGACYCALYVNNSIFKGEKDAEPIQERRKTGEKARLPLWRCRVCGYLCARENPPEFCPICKVGSERFEKFL